jgi:triosephosphate isomerase
MLVAGNWKMNPATADEAGSLAEELTRIVPTIDGVEVVVCPPTLWLERVRNVVHGTPILVGAQTMHWEDRGAFTGETSPAMLAGLATHVIVGHSERRQYDGETDEAVGRKVAAALAHGLVPIAAIGERLEERQAGDVDAVIHRQLEAAVGGIEAAGDLVVAYEPVWAIGTGMAATGGDAQEVASLIRAILGSRFGPEDAASVPILYGGSVTSENAAEFFGQADIDGALVGGASLKHEDFASIVRAAGASVT